MFKFLKKKLKRFEKKLEEEIETELEKDQPLSEPKHIEQPVEEQPPVEPEPSVEKKPVSTTPTAAEEKLIAVEEKSTPPKRKRARAAQKIVSKEKQARIDAEDKKIEQSIETELQRTIATRKSLEQLGETEKKSKKAIDPAKLDDLLWDLEVSLLESDVAYTVIDAIKKDIRSEISRLSFSKAKTSELVETVLRNAISHVLSSNDFDFQEFINSKDKPIVLMFVGVNGTGKTLSIAKVAKLLQKQGKSCVMAAGDTFRAGAIEQLTIHAEKLGVKIIKHGPGSDPAAVAYDAIEHAKAKHKDVVLLDTAGRMQTNYNLMDEMAKIKRVAKPDLIIFVGDALSGNDAVEQAKRFNEVVGIDGVILTKVDTDAKGGSSLSIAYTIGKPLLFVGVGQEYDDQIPFDPEWMIQNLFGEESD